MSERGSADVSSHRLCAKWFLEYSWKIWARKGRLLGLISMSVEEEKSPGGRAPFVSLRGKVIGDA